MIRIGNQIIDYIYLGDTQIDYVYFGDSEELLQYITTNKDSILMDKENGSFGEVFIFSNNKFKIIV